MTTPRSPDSGFRPPEDARSWQRAIRNERIELLDHLTAALDPAMARLGLIFLVLLLLDYAGSDPAWVDSALQFIWIVFLVEFAVRFVVAPTKLRFLRQNWLGALSLALPVVRPLRALRAARALRSLSLVRLLGGVNRGMRVLRRVTGGERLVYVGALTVLVVIAAAVGVRSFERGAEDATIRSFSDALWWAAAMATTINNEKYVVTLEGRVIAILLRIYAVSIFGLLTASIATYLIGRDAQGDQPADRDDTGSGSSTAELVALRAEVAILRQELAARPLWRERPGGDEPMSNASVASASSVGQDAVHRRRCSHPARHNGPVLAEPGSTDAGAVASAVHGSTQARRP